MDAHTSNHLAPDKGEKRIPPSLKGPAWGFGITSGLLGIWLAVAAVSLPLYRGGMFLFWGMLCFVSICFFVILVYRLITSKVLRVIYLVFAIPISVLLQPLLTVGAGIMVGGIHASRAQQDAAPLVAFVEREKAGTGIPPKDILPALEKVKDRSLMRCVWYAAGEKDYELSVWVTSFYYFDPHLVITVYSSQQGSWSGPKPRAPGPYPDGRTVLRYQYERPAGPWKGEKVPVK